MSTSVAKALEAAAQAADNEARRLLEETGCNSPGGVACMSAAACKPTRVPA